MKRPYPSYKPSGVEWLGDVPEHWEVRQLGRVGSFFKGGGGTKADEVEGGVPCVRYGDLYTQHQFLIRHTRAGIAEEATGSYRRLRYGDVLFAGSGETIEEIGKSAVNLIEGSAYCGGDVIVFRPAIKVDAAFLGYAGDCHPSIYQKACMGRGVTVMHIYSSELKQLVVPLPSLDEQRAISTFLDHESAQIDSLIAKKQQLIERLAEYRTALITRTVTRGLPPDAAEAAGLNPKPALKDSGVEWIGDVPEHWKVLANRRMFCERDERSEDGEGELLTVSHITGVTRRSEKPDVGMFMAESLEDYKCCSRGDFVINTMWAWMGAAGTAREPGLVSPSYNVYMPDRQRLIPRFVDLAYRSSRYVLGMTSESRGIWSSRLRLYPQHFLSLVTAVPPLREQEAIIAHIDAVEERFARLNAAVSAAIERLQEYRTALITAAVTGKIDVRDREQVKAGARV
jgi:type I restriction enzyme S subunit